MATLGCGVGELGDFSPFSKRHATANAYLSDELQKRVVEDALGGRNTDLPSSVYAKHAVESICRRSIELRWDSVRIPPRDVVIVEER